MTRDQLRLDIRARLDASGLSMRKFAKRHRLTVSHLCAFLKHGERPQFPIARLGYRRVDAEETYEVHRRA